MPRSYDPAYASEFQVNSNIEKQYISSFWGHWILDKCKVSMAVLFREAGKFTRILVQSRLSVLCLENSGKSELPTVPIYEEAEIAFEAEGLFIRIIESGERNGKKP